MPTTDHEELLIVVDEQDNVLDYLPRAEVHKKNLLHRTISVVVFTGDGKLVIQRRSLSKDTYPGMLSNAAGGHVIKGQDYKQAAEQEAFEEIGLKGTLTLVRRKILEDPIHRTMTSIFKTLSDGPFKRNIEEVDEILQIPVSEVKNFINQFYPATKQVMKELEIL